MVVNAFVLVFHYFGTTVQMTHVIGACIYLTSLGTGFLSSRKEV